MIFVYSVSFGASDSSRGGVALSRYYNPYYTERAGAGMAAFMFKQPDDQPSQYYLPTPDRRRQTQPELTYLPPQQNEVFYPQPQQPQSPTEPTELAEPTERIDLATTIKSVPEITEPEIEEVEEPVQRPKKRLQKKKQVKRPVEDEEDDDDFAPRMPAAAFFPMFFGYGGRSGSGGMPGGATAVANAYSTGRGGVASSHATAYGAPRPESKV